MKPSPAVVDTNVLLVANRSHGDATEECIANCARALQQFSGGQMRLVLDASWEIIGEYRRNLDSRKSGVGDAFLKWVLTNHANSDRVEKVSVTAHNERTYAEFPAHQDLKGFDVSDRKFVAVACAHPERPPILQALDSKWIGCLDAFHSEGVRIDLLCTEQIKQTFAKKFPQKTSATRSNAKRKK